MSCVFTICQTVYSIKSRCVHQNVCQITGIIQITRNRRIPVVCNECLFRWNPLSRIECAPLYYYNSLCATQLCHSRPMFAFRVPRISRVSPWLMVKMRSITPAGLVSQNCDAGNKWVHFAVPIPPS